MATKRDPLTVSPEGKVEDDPKLAQLRVLTHLLDRAFKVPGTNWRFGLDAILGLVPGLGDMAGALFGGYSIYIARQLGAPSSIQMRMLMNLGIDAVVGIIPFAGDLFDFAFKAHSKNAALLEQWLSTPHKTQRSSIAVLAIAFVVLLGILGVAGWVLTRSFNWIAA